MLNQRMVRKSYSLGKDGYDVEKYYQIADGLLQGRNSQMLNEKDNEGVKSKKGEVKCRLSM